MAWRLSYSLETLQSEIDKRFPNRSKATDGSISGYPGSVSSHNANSLGVVCAHDFTVGNYPGGITHEQAVPLCDEIRLAMRDKPFGKYPYIIYNRRIAHGDINWEWAPYTGSDPHTNHFHVSSDWDIAAGGAPSGLSEYDSRIPWLSEKAPVIAPASSTKPKPIPAKPAPAKPKPAAVLVNRIVTNDVAYVRTAPRANAPLMFPGFGKGTVIAVKGFVVGENPYGANPPDNAWYVTKSGGFLWANAAQNTIAGLPNLS